MEALRNYRLRLSLLAAVLATLGLGALLIPFRSSFTSAASALLFIIVVVAVAVAGNRFTGFTASIGAALWFDFFLTRPYESANQSAKRYPDNGMHRGCWFHRHGVGGEESPQLPGGY